MSNVSATLKWTGGQRFEAANQTGKVIVVDGRKEAGPSPMDLLLEAAAGCSAIDVVLIMEKMRQPLTGLEAAIDGERNDTEPKYYRKAALRFDLWGEGLDADKAERAIQLSIAKYCSVFHSLRKDLEFRADYRLHSPGAAAAGDWRPVDFSGSASAAR